MTESRGFFQISLGWLVFPSWSPKPPNLVTDILPDAQSKGIDLGNEMWNFSLTTWNTLDSIVRGAMREVTPFWVREAL
jgi:hypothetical protein